MSKYDWNLIQQDYDNGLSQNELIEKYGMSSGTIFNARRKGFLSTRTRSEAMKLAFKKHPIHRTNEQKQRLREVALARYAAGWLPKAGRCKKFWYDSPTAGRVSLDGTWELIVAEFMDSSGWHWTRNKERFEYEHLTGKISWYTPDFYVAELGGYLEVKGYETPLDRCKWSQFPNKLTVWKKDVIDSIKKYGRVA